MSGPRTTLVLEALKATELLTTAIVVQLAASCAGTRQETHACLERAIALARELVTRLEAAQTLYAATPIEHEPVDSTQWTGRHG